MRPRIYSIDIARALSIIGVMIIHTYSYHLVSPAHVAVWNFLQFVVITFVFVSGYVLKPFESFSMGSVISWIKKRFIRLYVPFLLYFLIHFSLFVGFPSLFHNLGMQRSVWYFLSSILLIGGLNTTWLPLLFLELAILTPFLFVLQKKNLLWIYIVGASLFTCWISFIYHFPYAQYRLVMWIPWSIIYLFGWYCSQSKQRVYLFTFLVSCLVFTFSYFMMQSSRSLLFYDNKYPPTFFYLSFGMLCTMITLLVSHLLEKSERVKRIAFAVSTMSYQLFFFHFIFLDVIEYLKISNTALEAGIVVVGSISFYYCLEVIVQGISSYLRLQRATA